MKMVELLPLKVYLFTLKCKKIHIYHNTCTVKEKSLYTYLVVTEAVSQTQFCAENSTLVDG